MYYVSHQLATCAVLEYAMKYRILKCLIHLKGQNRVMLDYFGSIECFKLDTSTTGAK